MLRPKAILFDLDGTLVDSARDLQDAINTLLMEAGLRQLGLGDVKSMVGDGTTKLVERALVATGGNVENLQDYSRRFLEIYGAHPSRHTLPYPGVVETLTRLRSKGLSLAVVTNKPYTATVQILDDLGLHGFFATVIGGDTLPERKPHPAPVRLALERLGATPETALMVGDNYHDVTAAHAAGIQAVIVTYGYSHKPHCELGADRLIGQMNELLHLLDDSSVQ